MPLACDEVQGVSKRNSMLSCDFNNVTPGSSAAGEDSGGAGERLIAQLLTEMDGVSQRGTPILNSRLRGIYRPYLTMISPHQEPSRCLGLPTDPTLWILP